MSIVNRKLVQLHRAAANELRAKQQAAQPQRIGRYVVMFNGPPGCGKDTIVNHLWHVRDDVTRVKLSQPIKDGLRAAWNISNEFEQLLESNQLEKNRPRPEFMMKSWRQLQIDFSESYMKPTFGSGIFGRMAMMRAERGQKLLCISDSGFAEECHAFVDRYGKEYCLLVRIHRPGCDFSNDSRSYITLPGVRTLSIWNDTTQDNYFDLVKKLLAGWLGEDDADDDTDADADEGYDNDDDDHNYW